MEDQENVAPAAATTMDEPWWMHLAQDASHNTVAVEGAKVETFARKCYRKFFSQQTMDKETYFQCCGVAWMVQRVESGEWTAKQLWEATQSALSVASAEAVAVAGDEMCLTGWLLPKLDESASSSSLYFSKSFSHRDPDERYIHLWIQLWKRFYNACEEREGAFQSTLRPAKRQRTTYHYYSTAKSAWDDVMKGAYKLPTVVLLASILLQQPQPQEQNNVSGCSWQELDAQVHGLVKIFKTFTAGDIEAGLVALGMQCLWQGRQVPGLTPCFLLEHYINRAG